MKKLLFVATAALCATVFGAIESTNVVGYQNKTVRTAGFTMITPTFAKVDGSSFKIGDFGAVQSTEALQMLDENAATLRTFTYFEANALYDGMAAGWYDTDNDFEPADDVVVTPGTSLMFESQGTEKIMFAGVVSKSGAPVTTGAAGFSMIGNGTPVGVKLKNITFEGIGSTDSIQILDENAATLTTYTYFAANALYDGMEAGWYDVDNDFESADDVVIEAGTGLLFEANNGVAVKVTFPAAL